MFQTNKINRLAEGVFKEEGQINISGQGMLRKMFLSAYLSEDGRQILPPREHFYFNRNSHTGIDQALVHKVATYFILTEDEAIEQVRFWENRFLEKARENNIRFGKYGFFQFDNQLNFISDSLYIYDWLPAISYQPTSIHVHEYLSFEPTYATPLLNGKSKRKRTILIPALWSVLVCFFVFAAFLWSEPLNLLLDKKAEMNSRLVNVAPKSYSSNEGMDYFSDTHEMESRDADTNEKSNIIIKDGLVASDENTTGIPEDSKSALNEEVKAKPSVIYEEKIESPAEIPTEVTPRCTLIVGAFANPDNVNRMVSRLDIYNVEVITMERQTLTLVGAQVKCGDKTQIDKLKTQIEPNAWFYEK